MNLRAVKTNTWNGGFQAELQIPIEKTTQNWELLMKFNASVSSADFFHGDMVDFVYGDTEVTVKSKSWSSKQNAGTTYKSGFVVKSVS